MRGKEELSRIRTGRNIRYGFRDHVGEPALAGTERVRRGAVADAPVSGVDLYPTIAELAGERAEPGPTQGRSLLPLLASEKAPWPQRDLYWYYPHYSPQARRPGAAIRSGDLKLVEHYDPPAVELYNLADDPGESRDLADAEPAKTAELREKLTDWIAENVPIRHHINPDYDPDKAAREDPE